MLVQSPVPAPWGLAQEDSGAQLRRRRTRTEHISERFIARENSDLASPCFVQPPLVTRELIRLAKPSSSVLQLLKSSRKGQQLLQQICDTSQSQDNSSPYDETRHKQIECSLREIHACLLEADDDLMDPNLSETADQEVVLSCRTWLHKLQSFVLAMQREMASLLMSRAAGSLSDKLRSSGHDTYRAWQAFLHAVALESRQLVVAVDHAPSPQLGAEVVDAVVHNEQHAPIAAETHQQDQEAKPQPIQTMRTASRLVCARSRLDYKTFWARRIGV